MCPGEGCAVRCIEHRCICPPRAFLAPLHQRLSLLTLHGSTQYDDHSDTSEANPSATLRAFEELGHTTPNADAPGRLRKERQKLATMLGGSTVPVCYQPPTSRSQAHAHGVGTVYNVKEFLITTPQDEPPTTVSTQ